MVILHLFVLLAGAYSFYLYQLYLALKNIIKFKNDNFIALNNLMFNSENSLYVMIYLGTLVFMLDFIYFVRRGKRQ